MLFCVLFTFKTLYLNTENVSEDNKKVMYSPSRMKLSSANFPRLKCGPCNEFLLEKVGIT